MRNLASHVRYHPTLRGLILGLGFAGSVLTPYFFDGSDANIAPQRIMFAFAAGLLFADLLETAFVRLASDAKRRSNLDYLIFFYALGSAFGVLTFLQTWDPFEPVAAQFVQAGAAGLFFGAFMVLFSPLFRASSAATLYYEVPVDQKYTHLNKLVAILWTPIAICLLTAFAIFGDVDPDQSGFVMFFVVFTMSFNPRAPIKARGVPPMLMPRVLGTVVLLVALLAMGD